MTTNNAVNNGLTGQTGTGNFVGSNSPTLVTPNLGAAIANTIAFNPTTDGIIGTTAADNAGAGLVGEVISSTIASGSAVSLSNNTPADITTISLTAGDWDVWGLPVVNASGLNMTAVVGWVSTTSATLPDASVTVECNTAGTSKFSATVYQRINVSGTTTVYLSCRSNFASGTSTAFGNIFARRAR
jgi:hypothetical protein